MRGERIFFCLKIMFTTLFILTLIFFDNKALMPSIPKLRELPQAKKKRK